MVLVQAEAIYFIHLEVLQSRSVPYRPRYLTSILQCLCNLV